MSQLSEFIEQVLPPVPDDEIPQDGFIRRIEAEFGDKRQLMVVGGLQTGKTNLLAQFVRQHSDQCVCYFITSNPFTQRQHTFLFTMCCELSLIFGTNLPSERQTLDNLKNIFSAQTVKLAQRAKQTKTTYYFVVDGLEQAFEGVEGERIIDVLPPPSPRYGPNLLLSCRSEDVNKLPKYLEVTTIRPSEFNRYETGEYLKDLGFSCQDLEEIQQKYHGIPGYLRIIKDVRRANPGFNANTAPIELDRLVNQQVELALKSQNQYCAEALEFLAASPAPLPCKILAQLVGTDETALVESLKQVSVVRYDPVKCCVEFSSDLVFECIRKRIGSRRKDLTESIASYVKVNLPEQDFLLTLLLQENQDYEGIRHLLSDRKIVATIDATGDISHVLQRLRLASRMAKQRNRVEDVIEWTLGIAAIQSFISNAIDSNEITALLSMGASQEALGRAYAIPDPAIKIRLLARAYASMKDFGNIIPASALDELKTLVQRLDLGTLDKDVVNGIALDLFPVLPEISLSLLEKTIERSRKRSIIEIAIESIQADIRNSASDDLTFFSKGVSDSGQVAQLLSTWLNGLPLSRLLDDLNPIEDAAAKEYIIRQWCRQNQENAEIVKAVDLWLDTVIGNKALPFLLRGLRHISEVVQKVALPDRARIIDRLRIPGFMALDSPKEEWVRFHLNLAEAFCEIDPSFSRTEMERIYKEILEAPLDSDVKAFCLARSWATARKVLPDSNPLAATVSEQFQAAFSALLSDSAEQLEPVIATFEALSDVDPITALTVALDLNTYPRRVRAIRRILEYTLINQGGDDIARFIADALDSLDKIQQGIALVEVTTELAGRESSLALPNILVLLNHAKQIGDPTFKARALGNLAMLLHQNAFPDDAKDAMRQAIESWKHEKDLRTQLVTGFDLVQRLSKLDLDAARNLYAKCQDLKVSPGAVLATGHLGILYQEILYVAIRSITMRDLSDPEPQANCLQDFIQHIPSELEQIQLLATLAAAAYRVGHSQYADNLVRTKVIRLLERMYPDPGADQPLSEFDYNHVLRFCLPILYEYDPQMAKELSGRLQYPEKDHAWHSVVFWILSKSFLGDHDFEPDEIRVRNDHRTLRKAVDAAEGIDVDVLLCRSIAVIANVVKTSFDQLLDIAQAFDVLQQLDNLAMKKLPEKLPKCDSNIKHQGYLVLAQAHVHNARSEVYNLAIRLRRAKEVRLPFDLKDIKKTWTDIGKRAESIPNIADRVYVLALVAAEMMPCNPNDLSSARSLLQEAESQIRDIPTVFDRADRLSTIANSWAILREKTQAEVIIEQAYKLAMQLEGRSAESRLKMLVQATSGFSEQLADEFVARLDSRLPVSGLDSTTITLEIEKLRKNPERIYHFNSSDYVKGVILEQSSQKLTRDYAVGRGLIPTDSILQEWLTQAGSYWPEVSINVIHWVVESLCQRCSQASEQSKLEVFLRIAQLINDVATWLSVKRGDGIPEEYYDSFPGLSSKVITFQPGDKERAQKWLAKWLRENAREYLKICDPYFGLEQLEFLVTVPLDCAIIVVTTDQHLSIKDPTKTKQEIEYYWRQLTARIPPKIQFIVVPHDQEDKFHGRAIITSGAGLNIDPSLNTLGKSFQHITILSKEDARDLEASYVDKLLSNAAWFVGGVSAEIIKI